MLTGDNICYYLYNLLFNSVIRSPHDYFSVVNMHAHSSTTKCLPI